MASSTASPPISNDGSFYDLASLHKETKVPKAFTWPNEALVETTTEEELDVPLIDIGAIKSTDEAAMAAAAETVRKACSKHGFFEVTNHGVDPNLIASALKEFDSIFSVPLAKKATARTKVAGYSIAHAERFNSSLPWNETFTCRYKHIHETDSQVVDFFKAMIGDTDDPQVERIG